MSEVGPEEARRVQGGQDGGQHQRAQRDLLRVPGHPEGGVAATHSLRQRLQGHGAGVTDGEQNNHDILPSTCNFYFVKSDGSARNLIPRADSVVTLGKFHDDDDFMGNFDEDGSFIGDYTQYNEEASQAMQNKLLYFSQFYNKVNS